jgi:hypothetical protein
MGDSFSNKILILDSKVINLVSHITQLAKFQQVLSEGEREEPQGLSPAAFCPGDLVLIKIPHDPWDLPEAPREGPYPVLLSIPTGIKVAGLDSCMHISQAKRWTPEPDAPILEPHPAPPAYSCEPVEDLNYLFKRITSNTKLMSSLSPFLWVIYILFFLLLFICAYKAWVISPPYILVPFILRVSLWATSPPEWIWLQ